MTPKEVEDVVGLATKLETVSNMINMGEKIRWGEETALMDRAASLLRTQAEEIDRCHARLEIDHVWVAGKTADAELERKDIPSNERGILPDGIECRDATIACLEQDLSTAQSTIERYREALEEAKGALEEAEDRDNRARFRANSPRQDAEVKHLRTSAIRRARSVLEGK